MPHLRERRGLFADLVGIAISPSGQVVPAPSKRRKDLHAELLRAVTAKDEDLARMIEEGRTV